MGLFKRVERNINARKYDKAIEQSTGLKKICLMVRNQGVEFSLGLSKSSNGTNLAFEMMSVTSAQMTFAEVFYTALDESFEKVGGSPDDMFNDLAEEIYRDYNKRRLIASRIFGIALAIFMQKVANSSNSTVNKNEIIKLIKNSEIKESFKDELSNNFSSMMDFYEDPMTGAGTEGAMVSHDLGVLAYSLVDMKLEGNHYADPLYMMTAITAETLTYRETNVSSFNADTLKKAKLLK